MSKSVYEILEEIASTTSKNDKEALLLEYSKDDPDGMLKECFRLAYSPTVNFYISSKTFPTKNVNESIVERDLYPAIVYTDLVMLYSRFYTGAKAIDKLSRILEELTCEAVSVVERIVLKDLRCGVGKQTINKVWKNLIVTPPRQGAKGCSKENLNYLAKKRKAIEQKADGSFMAYFGDFMTRSGQPVQLEPLQKHLECGAFDGYAFEGEIIFDETKASREDNGIVNKYIQGTASFEEKDSAIYLVWDCIQGNCYKPKGEDKTPNYKRREALESMILKYTAWCEENNVTPKIKMIKRQELVSMDEAQEIFEDYVRKGFEGCILKDMDAPWKAVDKPSHCVKMKRQDPADLLVVDIYEGTGKSKGMLGGVKLESCDGEIKTDCGSGFTDEQRKYYWDNKNEILGKIVEIEYEQVSKNSKTLQKSVTFPIFQKVRLDKLDADSYQDVLEKQRIKVNNN